MGRPAEIQHLAAALGRAGRSPTGTRAADHERAARGAAGPRGRHRLRRRTRLRTPPAARRDGAHPHLRRRLPPGQADHSLGGHQLLRHGQHRSAADPRSLRDGPPPTGCRPRLPGQIRPPISRPALPGLHAPAAGPTHHRGPPRLPVGPRSGTGSAGGGAPREYAGRAAPRAPRGRRRVSWRSLPAITPACGDWSSASPKSWAFGRLMPSPARRIPAKSTRRCWMSCRASLRALTRPPPICAFSPAARNSKNHSRRTRSDPRRWPTNATRCGANGSARWPGFSCPCLRAPRKPRPRNGWNGRWTTAPAGASSCRRRFWRPMRS